MNQMQPQFWDLPLTAIQRCWDKNDGSHDKSPGQDAFLVHPGRKCEFI
jgi:hypothetical protein